MPVLTECRRELTKRRASCHSRSSPFENISSSIVTVNGCGQHQLIPHLMEEKYKKRINKICVKRADEIISTSKCAKQPLTSAKSR